MHLEQRRGLRRWSFELEEDGVRFVRRGPFERLEERIAFESVPEDAFRATVASRALLWGALVSALLAFAAAVGMLAGIAREAPGSAAFFLCFTALFGIGFLLSRARYVGLRCGERELLFLADTPSREALDDFLAEVQRRRRHYLWTRYAALQPGATPADELQKIAWLHGQGVITRGEMELLKAQVIGGLTAQEFEEEDDGTPGEEAPDPRAWN